MDAPAAPPAGALAPLRHRAFALMWAAVVVANTGTWMRDVGLGWRMTELSGSPTLVAAMQAAAALPVLLLALLAGVLADLLDRRWLLFWAQAGLGLLALALVAMELLGLATPALLLAAALLGGIGAALSAPAWQSIVPQLVPRGALKSAVALNSAGVNVARAVGPALGGFLLAAAGAWAVFAADAVSFLGVLAVLLWWRAPAAARRAPPEAALGALRAGLRYAGASAGLRAVLLRAGAFLLFASAPWALLPLIARGMAGGGPGLYGLMLGAIGAGAVAGAFALPALRARIGGGPERTLLAATGGAAAAALALALAAGAIPALAACLLLGFCWIAALTTLNVAAQSALPDWVRARGLAIYLAVFSGAMMAGGLLWGAVAEQLGTGGSLGVASCGLLIAGLVVRRVALPADGDGLVPSEHMPGHETLAELPAPSAGPVLVQVEYRLAAPERRAALLGALAPLEAVRRRDGAIAWYALSDPADPLRVVEAFLVRDWAEHERMHARATAADMALHQAANAFDLDGRPQVRHLVGLPRARA